MIKSNLNDLINHLKDFGKEVENINGKKISLKSDENNMIDRQCPDDECKSVFKISVESLDDKKNNEHHCPYCNHINNNQAFFTEEQQNSINEQIMGSISDYWYSKKKIPEILASLNSSRELEISYQCEKCLCKFSTLGTAYFCPNCGNSVVENYSNIILEKIKLKLEKIETIVEDISEKLGKEDSIFIKKSIIEKSLSECITVLQSSSEIFYKKLTSKEPEFNAFQNVEKSNKHWKKALNKTLNDWITSDEIIKLNIAIQRRHILEHKNGILDDLYFTKTNDHKYKPGQRLVINPNDVIETSLIISNLLSKIQKDCT